MSPKKDIDGNFIFNDYPEFTPNLSPRDIFLLGSFGGTYWRKIYSKTNNKYYENYHLQYPKSWWKNIPNHYLTNEWKNYDKSINKYKVKVGQTLEEWEESGWIKEEHPYGWVNWYCDFFKGIRGNQDKYQIDRWLKLAGPKGRFRRALINLIIKKNTGYDDFTISPARRQTLQHWGFQITEKLLTKNE